VPALEAHYSLGVIRQPIDDLALAFVTPLGADHHYILRHDPGHPEKLSPQRRKDAGKLNSP
jgi:hypothetical protein